MRSIVFLLLSFGCSYCYGEWFAHDRAVYDTQRQDWASALRRLNESLIDHPDDPSLLYDAGVVSYKSGNYKQAQDYCKRATKSKIIESGLQKQAYFNLGNAHVALKEYKDAVDAYEQALKLEPSDERVKHNLQKAKMLLEQQKKEQEQKQNEKHEQEKQDQQKQEQNKQQGQQNKDTQDDKKQQQNGNQGNQDKDQKNEQKQDSKQDKQKDSQGQDQRNQQGQQQQDKQQQGSNGTDSKDQQQSGAQDKKEKQQQKNSGGNGREQKEQDTSGKQPDHKPTDKTSNDSQEQGQGDQGQQQKPERSPADTEGNQHQDATGEQTFDDHNQSPMQQDKKSGHRRPQPDDTQTQLPTQAMQLKQGEKQAQIGKQEPEGKKIDKRLMWVMEEQERKDAQRSKGLIKGVIGKQLVGQDGQHCW